MRSSHVFLIIALVAIGWVFFRGGEERYVANRVPIDYDRLAVSEGLTPEAAALNLQDDLDVSLLPEIGKSVIQDAARQGLKEQAFVEFLIREVSNRVHAISTIDLNADDVVDPILVRPEPQEGEQYVLLSIQVPAPEAYPLPEAGDAEAWKRVETIEVANLSVALNPEALTVQAQGNPHVYPNAAGQNYVAYDRTPSFLQMYFAMRMMDWLFFPRMYGFWGPGWGYGFYQPVAVPMALSRRAGTISSRGYQPAAGTSASAIRTRGGTVPTSQYSRAFGSTPPRSLNQLRSSASFQRRQAARLGAGGFGRTATGQRAPGRSAGSFSASRGAYSSGRTFGGGFGRPSFGGFGRSSGGFGRGFGGFRRR